MDYRSTDRLDWVTRLALATNKPRWWIAYSFPFAIIATAFTALVPGLPTREIYKTYYVDMLPRVQTVDFNMLFHILPSALSNAMDGHHVAEIKIAESKKDPNKYKQMSEDIEKILNSNYGVFYLLVTDENIKPKDIENNSSSIQENIFYETKSQGLVDVLDRGYIVHSDLILYPQPICSTASYPDNPKVEKLVENEDCQMEIQKAIAEKRSKVLGRVHYVKGRTPDFWMLVKQFNQNPLGDESGYHFIRHNLIFTFVIFSLLYWLIRLLLKRTVLQHELNEARDKAYEMEAIYMQNQNVILEIEKTAIYFEKQANEEAIKRQMLEIESQKIEAENELLEAQNKLLRLWEFDQAFRDQIDTIFTSDISNSLQRLDAQYLTILKRLETDVQTITHDIRKAPLLYSIDIIKDVVFKIENNGLDDTEKMNLFLEFLEKTDLTIQTINQVISNLEGMISLDSHPCEISKLLSDFESNLPSIIKTIPIEFSYHDCNCFIEINPWHFKSILKNILYNSRKVLVKKNLKNPNFQPKINISCALDKSKDEVEIIIEDNGDGISKEYLDKLYQSPERLNLSNGTISGNGSMIVFAYLSLSGGRAKAQNITNGGAKVIITFPIVKSIPIIS